MGGAEPVLALISLPLKKNLFMVTEVPSTMRHLGEFLQRVQQNLGTTTCSVSSFLRQHKNKKRALRQVFSAKKGVLGVDATYGPLYCASIQE